MSNTEKKFSTEYSNYFYSKVRLFTYDKFVEHMSYKKVLTDYINNDFPKKEQLLKARRDWAVEKESIASIELVTKYPRIPTIMRIISYNIQNEQLIKSACVIAVSFYVSNVKKELNFCDDNSVDMELRNSVFNETIFAEIVCHDLNKNEEEDEVEVVNFTANEIAIVFQDWVDISDTIFGLSNNQEETILAEEEVNMDFESRSLVQDVLSDSDL
ncbi:40939_t:CDS:2, partial [Gigaspora margarita]